MKWMRGHLVVVEVSLQVDVDHRVPLLLGHLPDRAVPGDPGVADQDVVSGRRCRLTRSTMASARRRSWRRRPGSRGPCGPSSRSPPPPRWRRVIVAPVVHRHVGALTPQLEGDRPPDAEAAAGDDGPFALEIKIHFPPPCPRERPSYSALRNSSITRASSVGRSIGRKCELLATTAVEDAGTSLSTLARAASRKVSLCSP